MSSGSKCQECGATIPADSLGGFCPQCLLNLALPGATSGADLSSVTEETGDRIGRYRLLQEIGHGGCGVVYMAEQEEAVRRKVALKVIKLGMDTKQVVARFEAERQALALMDHPNIAKVLDAGATETGRPYFVMELVGGVKITDYCDQHQLSTRERLDLFIQICRAIQHAHQKGIIHRDIKPSNVLVAKQDGVAVPKVIDFGIAKATQGRLTDQTLFTAFEQFLGTPAYMSPEQTQLGSLDVDTRSDIYSLGVLLYELLTGTTPFDTKELVAAGLDAMRRTILEKEPPTPSTRLKQGRLAGSPVGSGKSALRTSHSTIDQDLDWIVMKCLEKDRGRRYETANGLAMDIERHLRNEPVVAGPPSSLYRFHKAIRRNKTASTAAAVVAVVLVAGVLVSTWQAWRAIRAEQRSVIEAAKSQQVAGFLKALLRSISPEVARGNDTAMLREILDTTAQRIGREFKNQPEVEFELRSTLAAAYGDFGLYQQMNEMAQGCLQIAQTNWGEESLPVTEALQHSGFALSHLGNYVSSEATLRKALAIRKRLLGDTHLKVAETLNSLGNTLLHEGKVEEAERLHREALAIRREELGEDNQDVGESLANIAAVLEQQGSLSEAENMQRQVLTLLTNLSPQHPRIPEALINLSMLLRQQRKLIEAELVCREAYALARKEFGAEHPMLVQPLNILGLTLSDRRELAEAEKVLREALAMAEKVSGQDHPDVADVLTSLGDVLKQEYQLTDAETLTREALRIRRIAFTNDHRSVAAALEQLSSILAARNNLDEAESQGQKSLTMFRRLLGGKHPQLATSLNNRAVTLVRLNRLPEAEAALRESQEILRNAFGERHPLLGASLANLAVLLYQQGKRPEAVAKLREAIAAQRASSPGGLPDVQSLDDLAEMLEEQGDLAGAVTTMREALRLVRPANDDPAHETELFGVVSHHLAEMLLVANELTEARSVAEESVAAYRRHPEWPSHEKRHALMVLGNAYRRRGDCAALELLYQQEPQIVLLDALATALREQGKLAEAELRLREGLGLTPFKFGDPSQETSDFGVLSHHLADVLRLQKKFVEARSLAEDSVAAYRRHPEWANGEAQHAVRVLEAILSEMGDTDALEVHYRKKLEDLRTTSATDDAVVSSGLAQLALAQLAGSKYEEAEASARECLALREKQMPDNWLTFNTRSLLGASLLGQKHYEQAEPLLLAGYQGMKQREATIPEAGKVRLKEAARRLVQLYDATGRPDQAAEWKQRLAEFDEAPP